MDEEPSQGITKFIMDHHRGILTFLSLLQNITYWGVFIYIILRSDATKASTYMLLPEVCILGEFLFSIIWEANSHCVIPYYIIMIPLACIGWNDLLSKIMSHKQKSMVQ
ncbi:MAG: hypothetical protein NC094_05425 [Bacteroidales bacterium]|nr:hypothetical protein [Lachnoclostridium sp.]MCM1384177.1 hypothetical protein [Lachnoclostridium sp.]MCM1464843.1 hypothetical protein [Bacteroidales bacterium]